MDGRAALFCFSSRAINMALMSLRQASSEVVLVKMLLAHSLYGDTTYPYMVMCMICTDTNTIF